MTIQELLKEQKPSKDCYVTVRIDQDRKEYWQQVADLHDISMSKLIFLAVDNLTKYKEPK